MQDFVQRVLFVLVLAHLNLFFIFNFIYLLILTMFHFSLFQTLFFFTSLLLVETFWLSSPLFLYRFFVFSLIELRLLRFVFVLLTLILWIILIEFVFFLLYLLASFLFNKDFCVYITEAVFWFDWPANFIHCSKKVNFCGFDIWTHIDLVLFWTASASACI